MMIHDPRKPRMLFGSYYINYWEFMENKWIYAIILGMLLHLMFPISVHAYDYYVTSKNLTFNETKSYIVNDSIYRRVNITSLSLSLCGYLSDTQKDEEAEWAVTGVCTGENPCGNAMDEDWYTFARTLSTLYIRENYTLPSDIEIENATWRTKIESGGAYEIWCKNHSSASSTPDLSLTSGASTSLVTLNISLPPVCMNGSMLRVETKVSSDGDYYEGMVIYKDYPENVTIDIGNDGVLDYINTTDFNTNETITFNVTGVEAINNYIHDTCTADWQTGTCDVPFNWSSAAAGILEISSINISGEYVDIVTDCSEYHYAALNFSYHNEETDAGMSGNVSYSFIVFWDSENFTYNNSVNDTTYFEICVLNGTYTADIFIEYSATGYPKRHYFMDDAGICNETDDIHLYLLADAYADEITYTVRDAYQNLEDDTIIYAQRYFPSTDEYKTVAMGKTGPEGTTMMQLISDVWYKYILLRSGSVILNTNPQQLVDTDVELFIGVSGDLSFFNYYGNIASDCYYNETTMIFVCTYADTSGKLQEMNLTITERFLNNTAWDVICLDTSTSVSGTLTCNLTNYQNRTLYYELEGRHCCSETTWFTHASGIIDEIGQTLIGNLGLTAVLIGGILMLTVAAAGFYNPKLAIAYGLVAFVIISPVLGILPVNWTITGGIIVVAVLLIYNMSGGKTHGRVE